MPIQPEKARKDGGSRRKTGSERQLRILSQFAGMYQESENYWSGEI